MNDRWSDFCMVVQITGTMLVFVGWLAGLLAIAISGK